MRLIDATKVVQDILAERDKIPLRVPCAPYELLDDKPYAMGQAQRGGIRKALRCIEEAPTIDAVEVVRCMDCKHSEIDDPDLPSQHYCHAGCGWNDGDFYCSYGERRK